MSGDLVEIVRWPDGTWALKDDFDYEQDWAWKSDDYEVIKITQEEYEALL